MIDVDRTDTENQLKSLRLDEGEHICINSSVSYLSVVFHNSILNVRHFRKNSNDKLIETGKFLFPSEKGGLLFGEQIGSVDIESLIPATVKFSVLAFPKECSDFRYVTTESPAVVDLPMIAGEYTDESICIWYPQSEYDLSIQKSVSSENTLSLCRENDCSYPFMKNGLNQPVTEGSYLIVKAATKEFFEKFSLTFECVKQLNPFNIFGGFKENSKVTELSIEIIRNDPNRPDVNLPQDDNNDDNEQDDNNDDEINRLKENEEKVNKQYNAGKKHRKRRNESSVGTIASLFGFLIIIIAVVIIILECFVCKKRATKRDYNDQSETRLLGNNMNQNNQFSSYFGYPQQYFQGPFAVPHPQMPAQHPNENTKMEGVYFSQVTDQPVDQTPSNNYPQMYQAPQQPQEIYPKHI